jgi:hypothetical protein
LQAQFQTTKKKSEIEVYKINELVAGQGNTLGLNVQEFAVLGRASA